MSGYITKDAAKKKHCDICKETCVCYRSEDCSELRAFDLIPDEEVKPVVHGRWIIKQGRYGPIVECSECGDFRIVAEKFCPECGADMRL